MIEKCMKEIFLSNGKNMYVYHNNVFDREFTIECDG